MIFSGDNLPWALGMCGKLADSWSQQSCSGGVFMQNFNLPGKLSPFQSIYVKKDDLLYPCDWVRSKYKFYCYLQITQHILDATDYDWKKTAAWCAKAHEAVERHLLPVLRARRLGRIALRRRGRRRLLRASPGGARRLRLRRGARLREQRRRRRTRARFCELRARDVRGFCFYAMGTILTTFGKPKSWIASTCAAIAGTVCASAPASSTRPSTNLINNGSPTSWKSRGGVEAAARPLTHRLAATSTWREMRRSRAIRAVVRRKRCVAT